MPAPTAIVCEIATPRLAEAGALAEVATTCARELGQPISLKILSIGRAAAEPVLTLHLPAALASTQHEVWCLACRLACFCPQARISVLVRAEDEFKAPPLPVRAFPRSRRSA